MALLLHMISRPNPTITTLTMIIITITTTTIIIIISIIIITTNIANISIIITIIFIISYYHDYSYYNNLGFETPRGGGKLPSAIPQNLTAARRSHDERKPNKKYGDVLCMA